MPFTKSLVPERPICIPTLCSPAHPASLPYPCRPISDPISIAAPTTATAFLLVSLSKMPRGNFPLPQHPAPRHFRSRLTTIRPGDERALELSNRSHPWLRLPGWTCVCFAFTISRMTIIQASTSHFAWASPATTAATLSSICFVPSS
jgi:hypothetical protein